MYSSRLLRCFNLFTLRQIAVDVVDYLDVVILAVEVGEDVVVRRHVVFLYTTKI